MAGTQERMVQPQVLIVLRMLSVCRSTGMHRQAPTASADMRFTEMQKQ